MKSVILFALIALVAAKPESRVNVVDTPTMVAAKNIQVADVPVETKEGFSVKVVNEAVDMPANVQESKVQVVNEAVDMPANVQESKVQVVNEAVDMPSNVQQSKVKVVDLPEVAEPLRPSELETIRINPEILNQVRVIDTPVVSGWHPVKVYPSPLLRNNH